MVQISDSVERARILSVRELDNIAYGPVPLPPVEPTSPLAMVGIGWFRMVFIYRLLCEEGHSRPPLSQFGYS